MASAKSSAFRAAALALLLLALSLPLKFALPTGRADSDHMQARPEILHAFLVAAGVPIEAAYPVTSYGASGWKLRLPHCSAIAVPEWQVDEITDLLREMAGPDDDLHFVLRGRVTASPPYARAMIGRMLYVLSPILPNLEYRPFIVVVIAPKTCRDYENIPWAKLDD